MHAKFEMLIHIFFRVDFFQKIIKFLQGLKFSSGGKNVNCIWRATGGYWILFLQTGKSSCCLRSISHSNVHFYSGASSINSEEWKIFFSTCVLYSKCCAIDSLKNMVSWGRILHCLSERVLSENGEIGLFFVWMFEQKVQNFPEKWVFINQYKQAVSQISTVNSGENGILEMLGVKRWRTLKNPKL